MFRILSLTLALALAFLTPNMSEAQLATRAERNAFIFKRATYYYNIFLYCDKQATQKGMRGVPHEREMILCVNRYSPPYALRLLCQHHGKSGGLVGDQLNQYIRVCMASQEK